MIMIWVNIIEERLLKKINKMPFSCQILYHNNGAEGKGKRDANDES